MNKLIEKLSERSAESLAGFIESLYGSDKNLDQKIESFVLQNDPEALCKVLKKRVQSLNRSSRFIRYGESFEFARGLDALIDDIEELLLPQSARLAFDVLDRFLATDSKTFNRVDDSSGSVGDVYGRAVDLWLTAAAARRDKEKSKNRINWQDRVYTLFNNNDYGVFDGLIPASGQLLTKEELQQLASRFENEARHALADNSESYNFSASHACIGMRSVAEALGDIELYEKATIINSPQPNGLQLEELAKFSLRVGIPKSALKWLDKKWEERVESRRLALLDECYRLLDEPDKLLQVRRDIYQRSPNIHTFKALCQLLPEAERTQQTAQALDQATTLPDVIDAANILLGLDENERLEQLLVKRAGELKNRFYGSLTELAKRLEKRDLPLAQALCYRALLDDVLENGRSKAYPHASRYYRRLDALDRDIKDYKGQPDHQSYRERIRASHGRKRSFWALIDGEG